MSMLFPALVFGVLALLVVGLLATLIDVLLALAFKVGLLVALGWGGLLLWRHFQRRAGARREMLPGSRDHLDP